MLPTGPARSGHTSLEDLSHLGDLKQIELFKDLSEGNLKRLVTGSYICSLKSQQKFLLAPNPSSMYLILEGYIVISVKSNLLSAENFLAWRGPGQIIGEMMAVGRPSSIAPAEAIVSASSRHCKFLEMPGDLLAEIAKIDPYLYRNIARLLMDKMHQERDRLEIIQMSTTLRRVARTIINLYRERGYIDSTRGKIIKDRIMRDHIAGYIGRRRETVSRAITKLRLKNILDYSNQGQITIRRLEKLEAISIKRRRKKTGKSTAAKQG